MTMRTFLGFALGVTLTILTVTHGTWVLGRLLRVPGDVDYPARRA